MDRYSPEAVAVKGDGTLVLGWPGTALTIAADSFDPDALDGASLGTASLAWSDLFLASGAVINLDDGDVTLTHSADLLTLAGGNLQVPNLVIADTGNIGSASDTDAIQIEADGNVVFSQSVGVGVDPSSGEHFTVEDTTLDTTVTYHGIHNEHIKTDGATTEADDFYGIYNYTGMNQNGVTIGYMTGIFNRTVLTDGLVGDDVEELEGIYSEVIISAGTVSDKMIGHTSWLKLDGGTVSGDVIGHRVQVDIDAAMTAVSGDVFGELIVVDDDQTAAGTVYMLYLDEGTNIDYGIYQDGSAPNKLGGNLIMPDAGYIGSTTATTIMQLTAGGDIHLAPDTTFYSGTEDTITFGDVNDFVELTGGGTGGVNVRYGNLGIGITAWGDNATNTLGIRADGVVPTTSPAGIVQLFADDSSDGATNATLGIRTEQAVEAGAMTPSHKLKIWVNGTEYWLSLDAV